MSNINGLSSDEVKTRLKDVNKETPLLWATTSLVKAPQEVTARTAVRNNLMLDKVLANQSTIIRNQEAIAKKISLGTKLDVSG